MSGAQLGVSYSWRGTGRMAMLLFAFFLGCAPVPDPSAGLSKEESITLETIAEAFALNTRATDVQRENLQAELVGRRVEWDVPVYEVSLSDGRYEVTSQPIPIQDTEAVALIRVMAYVTPRNDEDVALLQVVKTDDVIRLRGIVQEIRLRTIVAVVPAVAVRADHPEAKAR
jgi:hypothetical protein